MRRSDFVKIMNGAIAALENVPGFGGMTCCHINESTIRVLSLYTAPPQRNTISRDYAEVFDVYGGSTLFKLSEVESFCEAVNPERVKDVRRWCLLMYKEMCLTFKLYKDFQL